MELDCGFPAWVFDGLFHEATLSRVVEEFPAGVDPRWQTFRGEHEQRKQQGGPACWGPATTGVILDLLAPKWCDRIAKLIGVDHLNGDVVGGGMHQSGPGAHLDVHVDFDRHPETLWRRKVNALLYLNRDWDESWGGCLELGGQKITPEFGRLVVFECSDHSWHGHPVPVADGHVRRSLATYYYDPDDLPEGPGHSTVWRD